MKKIMIFTCAIVAMVVFAMPAMADMEATGVVTMGSGSLGLNVLTYGLSSNVTLDYKQDSTYQMYSIASTHKAGNREFCTSNETTLIYYQTKGTGTTTVTDVTAGFTSTPGGWTAL